MFQLHSGRVNVCRNVARSVRNGRDRSLQIRWGSQAALPTKITLWFIIGIIYLFALLILY